MSEVEFSEEQKKVVGEMMQRQLQQQALVMNIHKFFYKTLSNWKGIGLMEDEMQAGNYVYNQFMQPPQPQVNPEGVQVQPDPGTD